MQPQNFNREQTISDMVARLKEENVPDLDILLFESHANTLSDEQLVIANRFFWNARV